MEAESIGPVSIVLIALYCAIFAGLALFGAHRYWLVYRYYRYRERVPREAPFPDSPLKVLIQLPLYNEKYVAERLIRCVAQMQYAAGKLEIQVLDDSTDETTETVARIVSELQSKGVSIQHLRRPERSGFKAGALEWGMEQSDAELIAIFDADFAPQPDFLLRMVGHFSDPAIGMVQARWDHLNADYGLLTQIQSLMLDGHFVIEHGSRSRTNCFFNFNGTAGIWRRTAIESAGGWQHDTLTEDLDLSYRAQMAGWKFVYRPDVAAPAEIPVSILAFKTQQHRWTKGSIQTARKLLGRIWRSPTCISCRIEATLHLLSNLTYLLMVALALLLFPVYAIRRRYGIDWLFWVDIPMLLAGTGALAAFYANARRELGRSPWRALAWLPLLMALGVGMSVNNATAAIEGWFGRGGEFVRTPKYDIRSRKDRWRRKSYPGRRQKWIPLAELGFFFYFVLTTAYCIAYQLWWTMPFLTLFLLGYGYVCALTLGAARSGGRG